MAFSVSKVIHSSLALWFSLGYITDGYKMCYSCNRIPYPRDCNHVTKCSEDENCYVKQYISDSGHLWYDSGCLSNQRCASAKRNIGNTFLDDVDGDITTCQRCCHGELCNSNGCGSEALPDRQSRGPVCFACNSQKLADSCDIVSICQQSEICSLTFTLANITKDPIYSSGCIRKEQCDSNSIMTGSRDTHSTCTGCCNQDYCNRNCSALGHATVTTQVTITDVPTVTQTTTNNPITQLPFEQIFCETANYTYDKKLGICYKLQSNITLPWQQARDHCRRDGADLIVFHSLNEESFFEAMVQEDRQPDGIRYWVGATDILSEMRFQWLDGIAVHPAFFHPNEPNDAFDGEDCLAATFFSNVDRRILLNDDNCDTTSNFICELNVTALQNTHSHQIMQEFCSTSGYTYSSQAKSCYKVFVDQLTMTEARWRCQADMADLLILRDVNEEQYFQHQSFHDKNNDHRYWVGGTRTLDNTDTFQWLDGSPLNPSLQWFAGEPNNYQDNESCLSMTYFDGDRENFLLNDDNCAKTLYYICEELCPDSTYSYIPSLDMCFKGYNETVTWSEACARCKQDRATLAEVDTIAKLTYFQSTLGEEAHRDGHKYWVGAHLSAKGEFHWLSTDQVVAKELWQSKEPSPGESCVALHYYPIQYGNAFKLNNRQCDLTDRFICQYIRGV